MTTATRTLGPLHLEDLEPHRFEDLVRQLLYDFRPWYQIEATGRSGGDDGFDARAYEIITLPDREEVSLDDEEADAPSLKEHRLWLIQCKREKAIGPAKIARHLKDLPRSSTDGTWGIIYAAACDFSLTARNSFRDEARKIGFSEVHLWGRGEIEDLLFQPKNDHLLFAYFGISLQVRKRSLRTDLRARLATKRKVRRFLHPGMPVLIRDASDARYPYLDEDLALDRYAKGRWSMMTFHGCGHDGLRFLFRRSMAFLDRDGQHWDFAETQNHARPHEFENPWAQDEQPSDPPDVRAIWMALDENERGWLEFEIVLPFESVLDIDEHGDEICDKPHIFTVEHASLRGLFREYQYHKLQANLGARSIEVNDEHRVERFPRTAKT